MEDAGRGVMGEGGNGCVWRAIGDLVGSSGRGFVWGGWYGPCLGCGIGFEEGALRGKISAEKRHCGLNRARCQGRVRRARGFLL